MVHDLVIDDLLYVARRMRPEDWHEITATTWFEDREKWALHTFGCAGPKWTVFRDSKPVIVGGLRDRGPVALEAWFVATTEFRACWHEMTRFAMLRLLPRAFAAGVLRIGAVVRETNECALEFVQRCGFKREGVFEAYGRGGENYQSWRLLQGDYDGWRRQRRG